MRKGKSDDEGNAELLAILRSKLGPGLVLDDLRRSFAGQDEAQDFAEQTLLLAPHMVQHFMHVWERGKAQRTAVNQARKVKKKAAKTKM